MILGRFYDESEGHEKMEEYKLPLEDILNSGDDNMKLGLEERQFGDPEKGWVKFSARIKFLVPSRQVLWN